MIFVMFQNSVKNSNLKVFCSYTFPPVVLIGSPFKFDYGFTPLSCFGGLDYVTNFNVIFTTVPTFHWSYGDVTVTHTFNNFSKTH